MGIRLLFAAPYSPESTGKPERLNRTIDSFLNEAYLEKPRTLDELNRLFNIWMDECYQHKPHSALGNKSPHSVYYSDQKALKFLEPDIVSNAFLHYEERKVDKSGCISFQGAKYEVGVHFVGYKVGIVYDPADISVLTIEYEGYPSWQAKKLVIGEITGPRPKLPPHMQKETPSSSRLLTAAAKENEKRIVKRTPAISYRSVKEDIQND